MGAEVQVCGSLNSASLSPASEEEQSALPHRRHHQLPGPLHLPGRPPRGLCPLSAPQVRGPGAASCSPLGPWARAGEAEKVQA